MTQTTLSTAADEAVLPLSANSPNGPPGAASFTGSGTFGTAVVSVQGKIKSSGSYSKLAVFDRNNGTMRSGNLALTDNTAFDFYIPNVAMYVSLKLVLESISSGSVVVDAESVPADLAPVVFMGPPLNTAATAQLVNVSSATAYTVGPNGATNPTFNVVTNVASAATGWSVTGRAAAGGADLTVISSGTNEPGVINAKGSGVINIGPTSTGQVYLGRGSVKVPIKANTMTALGTVQSSAPTIAQILGGILTQTGSTGAGAVTLPTGTAISAGMPLTPVAGDTFDCLFINLGGSQTLTITGATGSTVRGTAAIASGKNATMRFINTGSNAWDVLVNASA